MYHDLLIDGHVQFFGIWSLVVMDKIIGNKFQLGQRGKLDKWIFFFLCLPEGCRGLKKEWWITWSGAEGTGNLDLWAQHLRLLFTWAMRRPRTLWQPHWAMSWALQGREALVIPLTLGWDSKGMYPRSKNESHTIGPQKGLVTFSSWNCIETVQCC